MPAENSLICQPMQELSKFDAETCEKAYFRAEFRGLTQ